MGSVGDINWRELRPQSFANLELKAQGAGASVYRALLPSAHPAEKPLMVALRKPRITSMLALDRFEAEIRLRSNLSHPNLLPLIGACTTPPNYCTVSPWMNGGTMFDALHAKSVKMSFERLISLTLQFAKAMAHMHQVNLVHRDLKTANILLDEKWQNLMVADLDLAVDVNELLYAASRNGGRALHRGPSNGRLSHMVGTLVYMAPEVLQGRPHSFAADVYAFAITVNEMATCAVPYVDRKMPVPELHTVLETRFNEVKLRGAIVKNNLRPVLAHGVPEEFRRLIEQCWHPVPEQRPTFHQIVSQLETLLSKGSQYLSQFSGSTFDTDEHLAATSKNMKIDDTNIIFDEIKASALKPRKPIWELCDQKSQNPGYCRMEVETSNNNLEITAALSSTCGDRGPDRMEDRSLVETELSGLPNHHLFAVFDGHGGQACSEFAATHFPGALFRAWSNEDSTPESALIHAFEDVDYAFLKDSSMEENSGCTALSALVVDSTLFVANAGDCRCILSRKDGTVLSLSKDHLATDPAEQARVLARGGSVSVSGRVMGCLMVSRSLGDRPFKRYISSTPDVVKHHLTNDDDFIILASDGLWDVVPIDEAAALVRSTVRVPDLAAKRLALKAVELGSDDNISVIVAFFGGNVSFSYLEN
ncbi:Protein kinase and PP2C-like domain-containing protein [Gracilariopsis chorda]|uniref:Protein kinase and PP2C-like domain-containing protein n=1 Tax=Gracilariopsis chorda TaxID=448386 RepID=A0A2V3J3C2_9FLOR|nr:Protein kinase and PP2C-like domain-containing protein [Gracilariopsis chorda]|eukprot:PXF48885.1 Protein kinase and PP2C-like domain-containing protein [Gracilariopsis chorda]